MRAVVNEHADPGAVPPPARDAASFHEALPGYAPTPVHELHGAAEALGVAAVLVKDESSRLGLPAFKILGASWAVERALRGQPGTRTLLAASAGNHGRAVARVAAAHGLRCRVFLPRRSLPARREAIAGEGAEVVGVEPATAACLAASLAAGRPTVVATPGTVMAGLDCAEVSPAAWRSLHAGIHGTVAVTDDETRTAVAELAAAGLVIGESGAAPLAALRALATAGECRLLRSAARLGAGSRILLVATEGRTGA